MVGAADAPAMGSDRGGVAADAPAMGSDRGGVAVARAGWAWAPAFSVWLAPPVRGAALAAIVDVARGAIAWLGS
jgi:hypothetical protein